MSVASALNFANELVCSGIRNSHPHQQGIDLFEAPHQSVINLVEPQTLEHFICPVFGEFVVELELCVDECHQLIINFFEELFLDVVTSIVLIEE